MRKMSVSILVVAVVVLLSASMAMAAISTTKHNLSSSTTNSIKGDIQEICVYCHTPHGGDTTIPLWNRSVGTIAVTPYSSTSMSVPMSSTIGGVSRACFTCHDGVTSINSLANYNNGAYTGANTIIPVTSFSNLGTVMTNDHPVGVPMIPSISSGYIDPGTTGAIARTFGTTHTVECASCHDVHGASGQPLFLRAANTESAICLSCHNK
jgi:predicted CXXCH cytochrome family protein